MPLIVFRISNHGNINTKYVKIAYCISFSKILYHNAITGLGSSIADHGCKQEALNASTSTIVCKLQILYTLTQDIF